MPKHQNEFGSENDVDVVYLLLGFDLCWWVGLFVGKFNGK
jgi:hypothetical protein